MKTLVSCQKTVESFPPDNYSFSPADGHIDELSNKVLHGMNIILCFDELFLHWRSLFGF